ncbi:hypothetical protein JCM10135_02960 [Stetteria hydrogenophila]
MGGGPLNPEPPPCFQWSPPVNPPCTPTPPGFKWTRPSVGAACPAGLEGLSYSVCITVNTLFTVPPGGPGSLEFQGLPSPSELHWKEGGAGAAMERQGDPSVSSGAHQAALGGSGGAAGALPG